MHHSRTLSFSCWISVKWRVSELWLPLLPYTDRQTTAVVVIVVVMKEQFYNQLLLLLLQYLTDFYSCCCCCCDGQSYNQLLLQSPTDFYSCCCCDEGQLLWWWWRDSCCGGGGGDKGTFLQPTTTTITIRLQYTVTFSFSLFGIMRRKYNVMGFPHVTRTGQEFLWATVHTYLMKGMLAHHWHG